MRRWLARVRPDVEDDFAVVVVDELIDQVNQGRLFEGDRLRDDRDCKEIRARTG